MFKAALVVATMATSFLPASSYASAVSAGAGADAGAARGVLSAQYYGPGSGTGMGRHSGPGYCGPGSGTGMGRCRPVRVRVCRGGFGDGRGPRCYFERRMRC